MAEGTPIGALAVRIGADASDLISELKKADTALGKTSAALGDGVAAATKFATAAAVAGGALLAFTKHGADAADQMGKMAQKIGMSVEALSSLKYAASVSDVSLEQLGGSLRQLSKYMVENKVAGVSVEEQLLKIADEFAGAADGAGKTAVALKYFGKTGNELIPFLNLGRDGIQELRKEAEKLGVVMNGELAKAAEQFNDNLTKLKASSDALAVKMAGPLVDAIGKATKAMLDAKLEGEDFFAVWAAGWQTLATGTDSDKWSKELVQATDRLLEVQNALDAAKNNVATFGRNTFDDVAVKRWTAEVAKAQAEVDRLRAIKPIIAPEEEKKAVAEKKQMSVDGVDDKALDQVIAQAKAELAQEKEIFDIRHQVLVDSDKRELDQIALQNETKLKAQQEFSAQLIAQEEAIQDEIDRVQREAALGRMEREKNEKRDQISGTQQFLGNLGSLMNTNSRKTFEFGKAAAIAEGGVKAALATIEAWEFGNKIGGPYVGAAFGAAAAVAGINYLNNIRQQSFGGGGGAPTPAGQGASGIAAPSAAPASSSSRSGGPDTVIHLHGDRFGRKEVRALLEQLGEESRDGGRVVVAG